MLICFKSNENTLFDWVVLAHSWFGFFFCIMLAHGWVAIIFYIMLAHDRVFRPLWASIFSLSGQRKGTKRKATLCVGLRRLCALQLRAGAAELAIAQTVLALLRSKPPVLDNTKGDIRSKKRSKPVRWRLIRYYEHLNFSSVIPANAGIQK